MKKTLFFDVETTGLDPLQNDIVQIAGIIEYDGTVKKKFNIKMQPYSYDNIDAKALKVHGMDLATLKTFQPFHEGYLKLLSILDSHIDKFDPLDKMFVGGYNVNFDIDFLFKFFHKNGNRFGPGSYLNWNKLDPMYIVSTLIFFGKLEIENSKLETVCKHFGIEIDAHDALSDIEATRELFYLLTKGYEI